MVVVASCCCCGCLMAGREGDSCKEKKRKKFFSFSIFLGCRRELLSGPPCQTCSGRGRAFFLPWVFGPDQERPNIYWLGWAGSGHSSLLVCFFRWRRTSPTFQVPQRVKFLPLGLPVLYHATWQYSPRGKERSRKLPTLPTRLHRCRLGKREILPCCPIELRTIFFFFFHNDNFTVEMSEMTSMSL